MNKPSKKQAGIAVVVVALLGGTIYTIGAGAQDGAAKAGPASTATPAQARQRATLTVEAVTPETHNWPVHIAANGSVAPWQEAVVGSELGGLRLAEVLVNVGDVVKRGQTLARFATDSVAADLAQQEAALEEAAAGLAEAQGNADRARALASSGALSKQQTAQYLTQERSAGARLQSAQARVRSERLRLKQAQVTAPDDGVISARNATVGAVAAQGMELFKLVRKGRLEWRAEVPSSALLRIKPGQTVRLVNANGAEVRGSVRTVAPLADVVSRNALVYVDLPATDLVHGGMFASGQFELGSTSAMSVPQSAVVTRDGYDYVHLILADNKVKQTRVTLGRRTGNRVEVLQGLPLTARLVGRGGGFLADGDLVNVTAAPAKLAAK